MLTMNLLARFLHAYARHGSNRAYSDSASDKVNAHKLDLIIVLHTIKTQELILPVREIWINYLVSTDESDRS